MAGKIDEAVRTWALLALAIKMSGKLIKNHVFPGFEPFLLSNSEFEIHNFLVNNLVTHKTNLQAEFDLKSNSIPSRWLKNNKF